MLCGMQALGFIGELLSRDALMGVFTDVQRLHGLTGALDEPRFLECLARACILMLAHPPLSDAYPKEADRVDAVLRRVGLVSPTDLARRIRNPDFGYNSYTNGNFDSLRAIDFVDASVIAAHNAVLRAAAKANNASRPADTRKDPPAPVKTPLLEAKPDKIEAPKAVYTPVEPAEFTSYPDDATPEEYESARPSPVPTKPSVHTYRTLAPAGGGPMSTHTAGGIMSGHSTGGVMSPSMTGHIGYVMTAPPQGLPGYRTIAVPYEPGTTAPRYTFPMQGAVPMQPVPVHYAYGPMGVAYQTYVEEPTMVSPRLQNSHATSPNKGVTQRTLPVPFRR